MPWATYDSTAFPLNDPATLADTYMVDLIDSTFFYFDGCGPMNVAV